MIHPRFRIVLAAALPLVTALAVGCSDPTEGKPAATVADPAPVAAPSASATDADLYYIAEGSTIAFVGSKVTRSHEGGFHDFSGTITVPDGDPTRAAIDVTIDTGSLWTDTEKLTSHLRSADFFDVATYPTATFTSTAVEPAADGGFTITGNLGLHGVTRSIAFPAAVTLEPGSVSAQAEFSIKRFDFGIVYPGAADDLIRDDVLIRLDLVALPQKGSIDPPDADSGT